MSAGTARFGVGTGILTTTAGGEVVIRRVLVRVVSGPAAGAEAWLEGGTLTLGSHPDADLTLPDRSVSRYHAELGLLGEGVRVRDLGSTNGTFVDAARIEAIIVSPPVELRVGKARVELLPSDVPAPDPTEEMTQFGAMVGGSPAVRRAFAVLTRAAGSTAPVLIEGEAGVGKTEAARALHAASRRAEASLVMLDAIAIDAVPRVAPSFAQARGGTLLLTRIDEASGPFVRALLQELDGPTAKDVRLVVESRSDLRARVEAGAFPRDLFFHLAAVRVVLPPLRDRREDLPRLVRAIAARLDAPAPPLSSLSELRGASFPGNVRELARLVEFAVIQSRVQTGLGHAAAPSPLPDDLADLPFKAAKEKLVEGFERQYVAELLERHGGNVSRAAAEAGIDRNHLARLAKKHGLR